MNIIRMPQWIPTFVGMTVISLFSFNAHAEPFTYSPEPCEFKIVFPEKPFIEEKCSPDKKTCDEVATYTKAIDASSVNFRVTCLKEDPKILESYQPSDLNKILDKMVQDAGLQSFAHDAAQFDGGVHSAVNLASGTRNDREIFYTGQLWAGKKTILNFEGEMQGPQNNQVDELYSQILKSVTPKNMPVQTKPATTDQTGKKP